MLTRIILVALLGMSLASAKMYTFSLSDTMQAGSTTLKPGQYTLNVDGSKVILKDSNGKELSVKTKVETADQPYSETEILTRQNNKIDSIGLRGSKSRVVFE